MPGDLLRRDSPELLVRLGVAERLWDDFRTLHSGEATHSHSLLMLLLSTINKAALSSPSDLI